jgi:protein-tyrosine phosphatase
VSDVPENSRSDAQGIRPQIRLIEPADGGVTQPLQQYYWPSGEEAPEGTKASDPVSFRETAIRWNDLNVYGEDRSFPAGVLFSWEPVTPGSSSVRYDLRISQDADFREALVLRDLYEPRVEVLHLHIATRYYWKVTAHDAGQVLVTSPVWTFLTHDATPRWIGVPGITNVRDLGGWPLPGRRRVRQGILYRSSEMNSHVVITEEGKHILVNALGIRTDLDLRGQTEEARPVLDPERVKWINIPVQPYEAIGHSVYMPAYRQVFEVFADLSCYPILFHCWGGADRAGTVAFLLSALLGKSIEHLVRDYELTSLSVWGVRSRWSEEFQSLLAALLPYDDGTGNVNRQVEHYLLSIGVTPDEIRRIRDFLIVPDSAP